MSKTKKVIITIFGIIAVFIVLTVGVSAKFYFDVSKSMEKTYEPIGKSKNTNKLYRRNVDFKKQEAFSVLLLGIDTGDMGRTDQGRSDTIMIAVVNPKKKKTVLVSIAKDTYTEIVGRKVHDKINHAYAYGGISMAADTVSKLLDIPIDYYVSMNMGGMEELVNSIDGITIQNTLAFTQDNHSFPIGELHLDGDETLAYTRMRYEDPHGDYGRQERQRNVIKAITNKTVNLSSLTKYHSILDAVESNMKTNLKWSEMKSVIIDDRQAFYQIDSDQLKGESFMENNISYEKIQPSELQRIKLKLKTVLNKSNDQ
ncbi:LCP family glycopolymer transferase [Melissococcus plutonius]|uniref:LCP family glycopolymer transferase n=1 Tax=Melissococcus plutonius TaxID=33970 RepID=UPI003EE7CD6B